MVPGCCGPAETSSPDSRAAVEPWQDAALVLELSQITKIVKLKAFPAAVSGGRLYNTRTRVTSKFLDSMWGDRVCDFTVGERIDMPVNKCVCLCELMLKGDTSAL